jgi:hypothetical protein
MPNSPGRAGCTRCALSSTVKAFGEPCHQRRLLKSVEVLDDAVVVEDAHLVVGEDHGQEGVGGRLAAMLVARRGDARGGGGTVVAVGDVERRHGVEAGGDRGDPGFVAHHPDLVADAVVGGDVGVGAPAVRWPAIRASALVDVRDRRAAPGRSGR